MTAYGLTQCLIAAGVLAVIAVALGCTGAWLLTWRMPAEEQAGR